MIRLVPQSIYKQVRARAKRFDLQAILPQHDSIPGVLTISCRQRAANDWSCWIVEPFDERPAWKRWWNPKPSLPTWQPSLSNEGPVVWNNAGVQRGLAVQEGFLQAERYRFDRFAGLEIVAYATGRDLCRVWYVDWQNPFLPGVDPKTIKAGQPSSPSTAAPKLLADSLRARFQATAGKHPIITREGITYEPRNN